MIKYIKVDWPELQKFQELPEYNECYEYLGYTDHSYWCIFVPEELYYKVIIKEEFPKKYPNTNLGTIVCYENYAVVEGTTNYYYDESNIQKGNIALIHDENGNWHTSKIVACSDGFPIILEDSDFVIGINCELIGHRDPEIPF